MEIKNIIFDFGAVLIDWNPKYLYQKVFDKTEECENFLNNICTLEWNRQFDAGVPFQQGVDELTMEFPQYKNEIQMYKDRWIEMVGGEISENTALLDPLKEKYSLYGLTNWSAETFYKVYKRYEFFQCFEGIVVSGDEKMLKPDAQIYKLIMSRYHLKPEESLFIDDNLENVEAANNLNINSIHLHKDVDLRHELEKLKII